MMLNSSPIRTLKLAFAALALLALHNHNQVALADESDSAANATETSPNVTEVLEDVAQVVGCVAGTAALNSDAALKASLVAAINGTIDLQDPLTCGTSGDKAYCEYDFGDAESNFIEVCENLNGTVVDTSFEITCKYDGSIGGVIYSFDNSPACVDPSCDESKYYDQLQLTADEIASEMNNQPGLKNCDATISAANPSYGGCLSGLAIGALLALLTFV